MNLKIIDQHNPTPSFKVQQIEVAVLIYKLKSVTLTATLIINYICIIICMKQFLGNMSTHIKNYAKGTQLGNPQG